jgi:hypothetical protein
MALLSQSDLDAANALFVGDLNISREQIGAVLKAELAAAVAAADAWVDGNAGSFNSALPQPARGVLTAKQKARLLMYVLRKRYEVA